MSGYKYIMFETHVRGSDSGMVQQIPIIFPGDLVHADVAQAMQRVFHQMRREARPVSAGMLRVNAMYVNGMSETLSLKSRGEFDEIIINTHPHMHGLGFDDDHEASPAFTPKPEKLPTTSATLRKRFKSRR